MNALLAGLIGSILTVFITKVFEIIQKSREHKYSLQKAFFTKKLESAEAAVSQWYITASAIGALAKLYEKAPILDEGLEPQVFELMNATFAAKLNKVEELSNQVAHSFLLYFDVDESFWENESIQIYYSKLSSVKTLASSLNILYEFEAKKKGEESRAFFKQKIEELTDQIRPELSALSSVMEEFRVSTIKLLKEVRNEMKKYEA